MFLFLFACSSDPLISLNPDSVSWGEINFAEATPSDGYAPTQVVVFNESEEEIALSLTSFDWDHLCLVGFSNSGETLELATLTGQTSFVVQLSVCNYNPDQGERDTEVSGQFLLQAEQEKKTTELALPWSFTPVLRFGDTG